MTYSVEARATEAGHPGLNQRVQLVLKRGLDVFLSAGVLLALSPALAAIALAVRLDSPGPVLFRHRRIGQHGRPFDLYKFRSMAHGGDDAGYMDYLHRLIESERDGDRTGLPYRKLEDDPRVTRVGGFLRRYYLDELPQLWNILRGDMSLVGPRPHVQFEVDHYTEEQRRRLAVKPGATGLWQVAGKADCTFSELIGLDLEYIDRWSLGLDLQIILRTVLLVLRGGEGVWMRAAKRVPEKGEEEGAYEDSQGGSHRVRVLGPQPDPQLSRDPSSGPSGSLRPEPGAARSHPEPVP